AAGLLAAARAAERGRKTLLLEKNRKPGVKILMSGGTRCNLTQNTDARGIVEAFGAQGRFLHSALAALGPQDLVELFAAEGVPVKVEATGKIFPSSDKADDVLQALLRRLKRCGGTLAVGEEVRGISKHNEDFQVATSERTLSAASVLLTTGGQSYPGCGTRGDGYAWANALGHTIVRPRPALVPITTNAAWVHSLKGITVPDVKVRVTEATLPLSHAVPADGSASIRASIGSKGRRRDGWRGERRGSFLFTHFGISGPAVLDVSREITGHPQPDRLELECDFLPFLDDAEFDQVLRRASQQSGGKGIVTQLPGDLPRRLVDVLCSRAEIEPNLRVAEMSVAQRVRIVQTFKHCQIPVSGTLGFPKAEVTAGGVQLDEVDSRTMESRVVPGLFLAGEILDLDGPIGGYNFQAAFSTAWLAGANV
ncbi:MAG TPA: NAD(P)/FAD-dependent oxidoreductase, partial [Planctomycetaceae bacterium]|nr:NAD(P)/FAD-dependent oxidoreductase [Planctomycetaceae bacterium]